MSYTQPSTAELVARNKAAYEARLNQTTPPADKAFNTVQAVIQGMSHKGLYSYAADRVRASSALTAQGDDLDAIGEEYEVYRDQAIACVIVCALSADDDETLELSSIFVGPQGLQYQTDDSYTAPTTGISGTGLVITLSCVTEGSAGTLAVGDELTIEQPQAGIGRTATVTALTTAGSGTQSDEEYRILILDAERAEGGGGNSSDLRLWGESVTNVKRIYPFTGITSGTALPGQRTVYVEATSSYNSDGIADAALVSLVKAALIADPETGTSREILGLTSDTLFVESIIRTKIYIKIVGISVTSGTLAAAQTKVESALETYLTEFTPFVQGLDPDFDRMDELTAQYLGREAQNVLDSYGGTSQSVLFGTVVGTYLGKYQLKNYEKLCLGGITWESAT